MASSRSGSGLPWPRPSQMNIDVVSRSSDCCVLEYVPPSADGLLIRIVATATTRITVKLDNLFTTFSELPTVPSFCGAFFPTRTLLGLARRLMAGSVSGLRPGRKIFKFYFGQRQGSFYICICSYLCLYLYIYTSICKLACYLFWRKIGTRLPMLTLKVLQATK